MEAASPPTPCHHCLSVCWPILRHRQRLAEEAIPQDSDSLADRIEQMLPLTQCAQCGHPGCRPYAEAVAAGEAVDLCPPGGAALVVNFKI